MSDWGTFIPERRKAWESKYDPKFQESKDVRELRSAIAPLSSLPMKRWVKPRNPEGSTAEKAKYWIDLKQWLVDNKIKQQKCQVEIDGNPTWVYLFKKTKDAVMFKLTWG